MDQHGPIRCLVTMKDRRYARGICRRSVDGLSCQTISLQNPKTLCIGSEPTEAPSRPRNHFRDKRHRIVVSVGTLPAGTVYQDVVSGIDLFATCAGLPAAPSTRTDRLRVVPRAASEVFSGERRRGRRQLHGAGGLVEQVGQLQERGLGIGPCDELRRDRQPCRGVSGRHHH